MAIDYSNMNSVLSTLNKLMSPKTGKSQSVPVPLILAGGGQRSGLSASTIASRIIARKAEIGLPIGPLESGEVSKDEQMLRIIIEEIIKALVEDSVIDVAIPMGTTITGNGGNSGGPVTVVGQTMTNTSGYGVMH